jgi:hypothetical protein
MHNTLEGILQNHLRDLWGLGRPKKRNSAAPDDDGTSDVAPSSESEIDSELEDLNARRPRYNTRSSSTPGSSHGSNKGSDSDDAPPDSSTDSDSDGTIHAHSHFDDMDIEEDLPAAPVFNFTPEQVEAIRACIRTLSLPTHVNRPPVNLGESKHGRLKANEYLILFTIIFPIILPEFWAASAQSLPPGEAPYVDSYPDRMLRNFYHLTVSTNIIASFSTSDAEADEYHFHFLSYRRTVRTLFAKFKSKPNHHYAMHNHTILKYWGPLAALSEFPGERLNGMFQKIKTNRRTCMLTIVFICTFIIELICFYQMTWIIQCYDRCVGVADWMPCYGTNRRVTRR